MDNTNIFTSLEKYTGENFLTQCLAEVISHLLNVESDRAIGIELLNKLCAVNALHSFRIEESITIVTQHAIDTSILDMRVSSTDKEFYIEVKDMAAVDPDQLKKYKAVLQSSSAPNTGLVLLTRVSVLDTDHQGIPNKCVLWSEIHSCVEKLNCHEPISTYLVRSLRTYLEDKGMSMNKVTWEYERGVLALNALMQMIDNAIVGISSRISQGSGRARTYTGLYFEGGEYWCGISNHEPLLVIFEIGSPLKHDVKKVKKPSNRFHQENNNLYYELSLEEIHFHYLDADKQAEEINKFVKESYVEAQKMRK